MAYVTPTVSDFKAQFVRDFPYAPASVVGGGDDALKYVMNSDINTAIVMAGVNINEALFDAQEIYSLAYLLLSAHYLVTNIQASSQGLFSQAEWTVIQKSVGSMQGSYSIPDRIKSSPYFSILTTTKYGMQYLSLIAPMLCGHVVCVQGASTP